MEGNTFESINSNNKVSNQTYFFVFSILALTGFEYFYRAVYLIVPITLYAIFFFFTKRNTIDKGIILIIIAFSFLILVQTNLGYNRSLFTFFFLTISLFGYYFISKIIGPNFIDAFINFVFIFSLISLPFFLLTYYVPFMNFIAENVSIYFQPLSYDSEPNQLNEISRNILIYNFMNYYFAYNRNSGPFWEPGMFTIFVNIALFFNLIKTNRLITFKNIILTLTIVTTFSTTGYLGMFFIFISFILFHSTSKLKFIYIFPLIFISFYILNLDFMQEKILDQINVANKNGESRFGAMLVHLKLINDFPITGVGDGISRYVANYTNASSTANGLTLVFAKYGIPFGLLYFVLLLISCINIINYYLLKKNILLGYCFFILLLLLAFSQDITVRPFYFFLIIWGLFIPHQMGKIPKEIIN
jgi:hypothetical protein